MIGLGDQIVAQQLRMEARLMLVTAISKISHPEMVKSKMHKVGAYGGATATTTNIQSV